jgi:DNA-binding MarR family transcriptional regulator
MTSEERPVLLQRIEAVRHFDRFYQRRLAALDHAAAIHELTPAESAVVIALGEAGSGRCASWLSHRLQLAPAYLCRILKKFRAYGYVCAQQGLRDRRYRDFALTTRGQDVFLCIEAHHRKRVYAFMEKLPQRQQLRLIEAMQVIEEVLTRDPLQDFLEDWRERNPKACS